MSIHLVYCGVGSNLGDRMTYLSRGGEMLAAHPSVTFLRKSGIFETEPQYETVALPGASICTQGQFLNTVWEFQTLLSPYDLLKLLMRIEESCGRDRKLMTSQGPRTLDLDILFYDDWVIEDAVLTIPHPRLHTRRFVLEPLAELAPNLIHPVLRSTVWALLSALIESEHVP